MMHGRQLQASYGSSPAKIAIETIMEKASTQSILLFQD